jgi:hypothetical protein
VRHELNFYILFGINYFRRVDKFTDWEPFQSLVSDLISPRIQINWGQEADKAARNFTAAVASAYRLSTNKLTLADLNKDPLGLESLINISGS